MKKSPLIIAIILCLCFACKMDNHKKQSPKNATVTEGVNAKTTELTDENFALAESQLVFSKYIKDIAAATNTNGAGVFMHNKKAANPKDRTVVRINFDTQYSVAILDLNEEAILTMPETNGRYQSAWLITEDHYNPMAFDSPGIYKINQDNTGSRYVMLVIRTQVNMNNPADLAQVSALQEKLALRQNNRGSYIMTNSWDRDKVLAMRKKYQRIVKEKNIKSNVMFGKKGETTLENHNAGVATGWGGMTPQQAVYPNFQPENSNPATLTLKDVPVKAFWSITVYDQDGFVKGNSFNINSSFAEKDKNGAYIIQFGGDKISENYLDIFEGWNFILRMYEPTDAYFSGSWTVPQLIPLD